MTIQEGQKLPSVQLFTMAEGRPTPVMSDELFAGKKVVLFAVPGAYTPTCSQAHLPGYVVNADAFAEKGVELVCLSVNDPFVMGCWGESANADAIKMISDGNGEFTKALGLEMDGSGFGLGTRSQRYAMLVDDGVVKKLNIEAPGQFEVSGAETLLETL
jgi:peroxiredoxin